jgi:hypothetical protein
LFLVGFSAIPSPVLIIIYSIWAKNESVLHNLILLKDKEELRRDIELLSSNYKEIDLALNSKTKWMCLSPGNKDPAMKLQMDREEIERVESFKYLGVDLDSKLCFNSLMPAVPYMGQDFEGYISPPV